MMMGVVPLRAPAAMDVTEDTIEVLFETHYGALVRAVYLLLGDQGEAEEVVQEAFARLLVSWRRVRDPERIVGYLRVTALNLARGRLRKLEVRRRLAPKLVPVDEHELPAEALALIGDERRSVAAALSLLPPRQRECLVLRYYLGLSEAEIAQAMGIAKGSVKAHASRGLAALAGLLEEPQ
jgi:RNA polymerase sigma-70 factor (sigma-E family)